jgi:hypothetical protein
LYYRIPKKNNVEDFIFYLQLGWEHIISLDALDHQLFVLALIAMYTFKDWRKILVLVTAFTIGHSVTLALSSFNILKISSDWVEFLIPLTIVLTSLGAIVQKNKKKNHGKIQYYLALFFGLVHGMGFANTARIMLAKEQSLTVPLFGFNVGLELGQIVIVIAILMLFFIFFNILKTNRKDGILFVSSAVFALALKMTLERLPF